jgi:hypothetical protein
VTHHAASSVTTENSKKRSVSIGSTVWLDHHRHQWSRVRKRQNNGHYKNGTYWNEMAARFHRLFRVVAFNVKWHLEEVLWAQ